MKFLLPFTLLLCFIVRTGSAQVVEFGNVSVGDFKLQPAAGDTASAIILFDKGTAELEPNSTSGTVIKRHKRIKIIRKVGLLGLGNYTVTIPRDAQIKVKGATYNLEGNAIKKTELQDNGIMQHRFDKYYDEVAIAFPNVREGSIFEFSYTYKSPYYTVLDWEFQSKIPTRWSEFTVSLPSKDFIPYLQGGITPTEYETKYDGEYHHWLMKDVPAFIEEPLMPELNTYVSNVQFSARFKSWAAVHASLYSSPECLELVYKQPSLKDEVNEITTGFADPRQKVKAISNYVKQRVAFNDAFGVYGKHSLDLFKNKTGSVGDINLLLASMLDKAGFDVSMILLSTRGNGGIADRYLTLNQFDYILCEVALPDGQFMLVDATRKYLPYDMIPPECVTHRGFLVKKGKYGFVDFEPTQADKISLEADFKISEAGGLTGTLKSLKDGYAAYYARQKYFIGQEQDVKKHFIGSEAWNIDKAEFGNIANVDKPVVENYTLHIDEYAMVANDIIYLNPHVFLREDKNEFTASIRKYPIDLGLKRDRTILCNFTIPPGYQVDEMPQDKVITLPGNGAKCFFSFKQVGDKITVLSRLQYGRTLFEPTEYGAIKDFFDQLVARKAENIVLKKK